MKFRLTTTRMLYRKDEAEALEKLGFRFKKSECTDGHFFETGNPEMEFSTLEEFVKFVEQWHPIVVSKGMIEIYDGYRE